jgi:hypothetical protein
MNPTSRAEGYVTALLPLEHELEHCIRTRWITLRSALDAAGGAREPLGELLVLAGRITRAQLEAGLQQRSATVMADVPSSAVAAEGS